MIEINLSSIKEKDLEVFKLIESEMRRQESHIELIASENFTSIAVMEAQGSYLTNKYAEGYPYKRYYGGCEVIDEIEKIAIDRAKLLFNAEHANVQPHSGSQANMAVYFSVLNEGDTILGMDLSHGGHLTHGSNVNFSGKLYNFISYGVNNDGFLDYKELEEKALMHKPKMIVAGASSYSRIIDFGKIKNICDKVGSYMLVDMAHIAGLVATGLHPSPVKYADFVTSTTHKTLRGPRGGLILCKKQYSKLIDKSIFPGIQGGPLEHIIAAKAVCFKEAMDDTFKEYQQKVLDNSNKLSEELTKRGFDIVSGGTDNHLFLVDLRNKNITGKIAEKLLGEIGIAVNKNMIPFDNKSPFVTSGIRVGTPAVTSRGFGYEEMIEIANIIDELFKTEKVNKFKLHNRVKNMCETHRIYS